MKQSGFPPLEWFDVLSALQQAPRGAMRPVELEKQLMLPQYGLSRLLERMVDAGLLERRQCPVDRRGLYMAVTPSGRDIYKRMGSTYTAAIQRHLGAKLSDADAARLARLLDQLIDGKGMSS